MNTLYKRLGMENMELIERHEKATHYKKGNDLIIEVSTKLGNNCCFKLNNNYPFSKPKHITVNGNYYDKYMKTISHYIPLLKELTRKSCFCCDSITCDNNWSPSKRLWEIVDEVDYIAKIKRKLFYIFFCRKISETYLVHDIKLEAYIFHDL